VPEQRGVRAVEEVDAEIDELYANAPDAFTKKRDELAKRLKAEGRSDAAASVKSLRKPTQIAYILNQVARRFADEVGELVDVGRELARAQRKALRGGDASGDLRTAIGRQRDVVRDLTTKTGGLMRELGVSTTGHLDEIAGALQAALVDPIVGAQLEEGRLEKVPERAAGFPGAAPPREAEPADIPPPPKSAPRRKTAKETAREKQAAAREKQAEARAAKREKMLRAREEKERAKRDAARKKNDAKAAAQAEKRRAIIARAREAWDAAKTQARALGAQAAEARRTAEDLRADAKRLSDDAKRLAKEARDRAKEAAEAERAATKAESDAKKTEKEAKAAAAEANRLATKAQAD
jgi:hypothetical protein